MRKSFYRFFLEFWPIISEEELVDNWHIKYLCDKLQEAVEAVARGEKPKHNTIVINVPPGSSKSTICSQMLPAWTWTFMPHGRFICGSYAHDIALKDALKTRDIVQSDLYRSTFPDVELREDANKKGKFVNRKGGSRYACSVEGQVTGEHGHILLIDDPINPEQALSEAGLKGVQRWMEQTLPTRRIRTRNNSAIIIIIQQRLHESDPSGRALEKASETKPVLHLCFPGEIADDSEDSQPKPPEVADYYVDGLFDADRLNKDALQELKEDLGEYGYAGQILQRPVPLSGGLFKVGCLYYADTPPTKWRRLVRSWDKAGTEDAGAWSVGVKMGVDLGGRFWVVDVVRGQWGAYEREENIRSTAERDGTHVELVLEIEGGSGGKESGENTVRNLAGYNVHVYHPTGDKIARATPFASQVGGGNVYLVRGAWTDTYVTELQFFPNSKFKDQVDASSGAFNRIARKKRRVGALRK
ncbi:MAG: putative terminase large subunit [Prokaryotic dsDNA virus sp.]|nr:MAG: putative terminase large subunit [Prokaryotic dsDNA virus sp.]